MTQRPYTILMIAPTPFFADRGCHVRILEEAKALRDLGNKVIICTYHIGRDIEGFDIRRIVKIPWYNKLGAGPSYHKYYLDILLFLKCFSVIAKEKPDIIHAHLHEGVFIAKLCRLFRRIPVLFDLQGSLSEELLAHKFIKKGGVIYRGMRHMEGLIDRFADAVISSSTRSAEQLKKEFSVEQSRVHIVTDGIDAQVFKPQRNGTHIREKHNISADKKIVVYVGLLNKYQGIDCLLEAIPYVVKDFQKVHFLIAGFPDVEKYSRMARSSGVSEYVTFAGKIDYEQTPQYLGCADIAVTPKLSPTEGNLKIYSYMSSGLPTVAFDTPVNREILGELGIYAALGDAQSLAGALKNTVSNEGLIADLSGKVREKAVRDYSWASVAGKIIDIYDSIAFSKAR